MTDDRDDFLRAIAAAPCDLGPLCAFGDWLAEVEAPMPVRVEHLPDWLRRDWLTRTRTVRRGRRRRGHDPALAADPAAGLKLRPTPTVTGWHVWQEIEANAEQFGLASRMIDHWGTATVAGVRDCLVMEPYATFEDAARAFLGLARFVGGVPAASPHGARNRSVVRAILFPPLGVG